MIRPIVFLGLSQSEVSDLASGLDEVSNPLVHMPDLGQAESVISEKAPAVVVLDLDGASEATFRIVRDRLAQDGDMRCILLSTAAERIPSEAMPRMKGTAVLAKPVTAERLAKAVMAALAKEDDTGDEHTGTAGRAAGFVGSSAALAEIHGRIAAAGRSRAPVFVTGEAGTGKTLCARAIHLCSPRRPRPFITLNCGAIPPDRFESTVFGDADGSPPGTARNRPGAAADADGGTLFLDEICELDIALQSRLLHFLQTMQLNPPGSEQVREVDLRIVCATSRDPLAEIASGRLREDLYYCLYVIPIHMPALRDRPEDMVEIAEDALRRFNEAEGRSFTGISDEVRRLFRTHPWPGNVRQLLNTLHQAVVLNDGPQVSRRMLPREFLLQERATASPTKASALSSLVGRSLAEIEQLAIEETLRHCDGSIPRAARMLQVAPSTLYRKRDAWRGT